MSHLVNLATVIALLPLCHILTQHNKNFCIFLIPFFSRSSCFHDVYFHLLSNIFKKHTPKVLRFPTIEYASLSQPIPIGNIFPSNPTIEYPTTDTSLFNNVLAHLQKIRDHQAHTQILIQFCNGCCCLQVNCQ